MKTQTPTPKLSEPGNGECLVCGKQICDHDEEVRYYRQEQMKPHWDDRPFTRLEVMCFITLMLLAGLGLGIYFGRYL